MFFPGAVTVIDREVIGNAVLARLEGHKEWRTPMLALNDRFDGATLDCGAEDRQGLCVGATNWTHRAHHLDTETG